MTTTERPPSEPPPSAPGSNRPMLIAVVVLAVAVVAGLTAVVALTLNREPAPTPPAPSAQASPSPTSTPPPSATPEPPLTREQQAVAEAEAAYRAYLAVDDQISSTLPFGTDYGAYEQAFREVATGVALTEAGLAAGDLAAAGQRTAGTTEIESIQVMEVRLRDDGEYVPEVVFDVCVDYSAVDVLGPDGSSLKDESGPTRYQNIVTVRNYPDLGGWLVAERRSDGTTC